MMFSDITTAGVKCTITLLQKSKNIIDEIIIVDWYNPQIRTLLISVGQFGEHSPETVHCN